MSGTYRLSRVGVGSAFKVGFIVGLALSALILVPFGLLTALGVVGGAGKGGAGSALALGAAGGMMVVMPLVYGFVYGVVSALSALVYNVVARVVGGLEMTLEGAWKPAPFDREAAMRMIMGDAYPGPSDPSTTASPDTVTTAPDTMTTAPDTVTAARATSTHSEEGERKGGVPSIDDVWS